MMTPIPQKKHERKTVFWPTVALPLLWILGACSSNSDQIQTHSAQTQMAPDSDSVAPTLSSSPEKSTSGAETSVISDLVWVMKKEGAVTCSPDANQPGASGRELARAGIKTFEFKMGDDGKMTAAVCGLNVVHEQRFLIHKKDLVKSKALGFIQMK